LTEAAQTVQKTILVTEDDPDAREVLSVILAAEGLAVITAEDGQQALRLIERTPPDLIITDIQMPNLDGIELIKRLRAHPQLHRVPIVVLSAVSGGIADDAIKAGANQTTPKPMQLDALLGLIRQILA
jgi:CheY-like chemotaxis protein